MEYFSWHNFLCGLAALRELVFQTVHDSPDRVFDLIFASSSSVIPLLRKKVTHAKPPRRKEKEQACGPAIAGDSRIVGQCSGEGDAKSGNWTSCESRGFAICHQLPERRTSNIERRMKEEADGVVTSRQRRLFIRRSTFSVRCWTFLRISRRGMVDGRKRHHSLGTISFAALRLGVT